MSKRVITLFAASLVAVALVTASQPLGGAQAQPLSAASDCQTFTQTGKQVCGKFLTYWQGHGGVTQQGYPVSNEFREVSDVDGKTYTVQYFERAVFEAHPEKQPPYDVLLSLLGSMTYRQRYPSGAQELPIPQNPLPSRFFPETGKEIRGAFLTYWNNHGGLAQQGYPITNLVVEKSLLDGKEYTVQYFERAVFELHPENKAPYDVLLAQLGTLRFNQKYPNGEPQGTTQGTPLKVGEWGGMHISLTVNPDGSSHIEMDCAHGDLKQPILVDSAGNFNAVGTFVQEHGGPVRENEPDASHPARFVGTTDGTKMTVEIILMDQNVSKGIYPLAFGKQPTIFKCL